MNHQFYLDGNSKKISWAIVTKDKTTHQQRNHAELYLDKVTDLQSKYIALHVGLFWAIGTFIIKNKDSVEVVLEEKKMYQHLLHGGKNSDEFINKRIGFINQLISKRELKIKYTETEFENNIAKIKM